MTWVACLTPPGRGALGTLGLFGPRAWDVLRELFRPRHGSLPPSPPAGRFWLGRLGDEVADEVVVAVRRSSPVPWVEVHGHGGPEVLAFLAGLLTGRGLRPCTWQDFLAHTAADPLTAVAAAALAEAPTARTAGVLLDQHAGALGRALAAAVADLDAGRAVCAAGRLDELCRRADLGRHLTRPWRVVVAGAPNVGKSSLVNALAGFRRSVVSPTPGTTRDVVTTRLSVGGWPVELADTAGIRAAGDVLEEAGVHRARRAAASADLCLWVLDASEEPAWPSADAGPCRIVINKTDLPPRWDWPAVPGAVPVCAITGRGLEELWAALAGWLVPEAPPSGAAVPFTEDLARCVEAARGLVRDGASAEARALLAGLLPAGGQPA
jgi:tRNA modification GTPase